MDKISIVIPAKNEEGNVGLLYTELSGILKTLRADYEIIFVDDGSSDNTFKNLKKIHQKDKKVKVIKLRGNWGKSIALQSGFKYAKGEIIITMDADLQDNPVEIPKFIDKINQGYDLVSGWKKIRHDPLSKVLPSRVLNLVARSITSLKIHDINCGFKAYRRKVTANLNLYGELYRFIPILAASQNYKIAEIEVKHRRRKYGLSKYGVGRNLKGLVDLLTIIFLTGYLSRPAHFFGGLGTILFSTGFVIGLYITYLRVTTGSIQFRHPLLYLGMLLMIVGIQLISTGLLAELMIYPRQKNSQTSFVDEILSS